MTLSVKSFAVKKKFYELLVKYQHAVDKVLFKVNA